MRLRSLLFRACLSLAVLLGGLASRAMAQAKLVSPDESFVVYTPSIWDLFADYQSGGSRSYPLLVYLHGANQTNETAYEPMLKSLALAGYYVLFPRYDAQSANSNDYYFHARDETLHALFNVNTLLTNPQYQGLFHSVDTGRIGLIGHSWGGAYALKMANNLRYVGVETKALVLHDPSGFNSDAAPLGAFPYWLDSWYLRLIPSNTRLVTIVSTDMVVQEVNSSTTLGSGEASGIWARAWHNTPVWSNYRHAFLAARTHRSVSTDYASYGAVWRNVTVNAMNSAFRGAYFSPTQSGTWTLNFDSITP
ncbi:MAG: hypothetical protein KDB14_31130 [Planctomycetales bacterium]|nr:hypothetical protein [Planctomycetales bacterium]